MAAPEYVPIPPTQPVRTYASPDFVPGRWLADRPADLQGPQPEGARFGYQGPDQGYGLVVANRFRDKLQLQSGEHADDAIQGCLTVALRRAALFGRAPMVHDFTVAFTIWGYLDASAPEELVSLRRRTFDGVRHTAHHYAEGRAIADMVPEATLRFTPQHVAQSYPAQWRDLLGV